MTWSREASLAGARASALARAKGKVSGGNPKFTKRHYIEIAKMLRKNPAMRGQINHYIKMFSKDNPRFDKQRFLQAVHGPTIKRRSLTQIGGKVKPYSPTKGKPYAAGPYD